MWYSPRGLPALVTPDGWKLKQVTLPKLNRYQLYHLPGDYCEERNVVYEQREGVERLGADLLRACDGNFHNGMPEAHHVWFPGINFHGLECYWDMAP